jgi:type I restriction enzyme S subunit
MSSDWKKVTLEEITELRVSNVDKKIYTDKKLVKLCNYMDVYRNRYITSKIPYSIGSANTSEINAFGLEKGDIIITKDSETPEDIGVASVVTESIENLVCGYHLAILKPNSVEVSSDFLMHLLHLPKVQQQFYRVASGSTRYGLTKGAIESLKLKIPEEKPQQTKIARILTTLDNVIEKTEAAIAKYEAIKQGMMHDLFTRGIGADGQLRPSYEEAPELYKESDLGWIPKEWEVSNIIEVSENGFKNGYFKKPELVGRGLKLINVTDIYQSFGIDTDHKKVERVQVSDSDYLKYKAKKGDLFFTRSSLVLSGIAKCNILREEKERTVFECHVMMLRPNSEVIDSDYLALYCLTSLARNLFMSYAKQVAMTTISQDDMSCLPVLLPSKKEQVLISQRIVQIQDLITKESNTLNKQTQLKQGLMQDLLTGKVQVEV